MATFNVTFDIPDDRVAEVLAAFGDAAGVRKWLREELISETRSRQRSAQTDQTTDIPITEA